MAAPLRDFPKELPTDPWPLLQPTPVDLAYLPRPETPAERQLRLQQVRPLHQAQAVRQQQQPSQPQHSSLLDFAAGAFRGALFGLCSFGLIFSIQARGTFWLSNWHWAYAAAAIVLFILVFGPKRILLVVLGASIVNAFWFSWGDLIFGATLMRTFWLSNWHWAYAAAAIVLFILVFGPKRTLLALVVLALLGALWLSRDAFFTQPSVLLLFIGGGVIMGCLFAFLSQKKA